MSNEPNLAKLHELDTIYNVAGLYNFLEALDFKEEAEELNRKELEQKRLQMQQQNNNASRRGKR